MKFDRDRMPGARRARWKDGLWLMVVLVLFGLTVYGLFNVRQFPHAWHAPTGVSRLSSTEVFFYEMIFLFMACMFGAGLYLAIKRFLGPP